MTSRVAMTRAEAAAVLGVPLDAGTDEVRHAWRMWARIAHPDTGGDPAHFARLDQARRVLADPAPAVTSSARPREPVPTPHAPLRSVLVRPPHPRVLVLLGVATALLAAAPAVLQAPTTLAIVATAMPAAVCAAVWAGYATRQALRPGADAGHVMAMLFLLWVPVALLQQVIAALAGVSLLPVLPVLAVPLVAAVAVVNPGAGLWRPVQAPPRR